MTTRTRHLIKEEEAVSPVIGVILMVAITVILAAVIGAFVFGMGGSLKKTYMVGVTASQSNETAVTFTFQGGPDADLVTHLNATVDGNYANATSVAIGSTWVSQGHASSARDHVVVAARFEDGNVQVVLDTYV